MHAAFQYDLLPVRVAGHIKNELVHGAWCGHLPSERDLCKQLRVSRFTLRLALKQLCRQGCLQPLARSGYAIVGPCVKPERPAERKAIGVLIGKTWRTMPFKDYYLLSKVEHNLRLAGYGVELMLHPVFVRRNLSGFLSTLVGNHKAAGWLLYAVPEAVQRWFAEKRLPTLVLGSCYANVVLPALDIDYRAVCRHAATLLLRRGHRRIGFIVDNHRFGGDRLSLIGFQEAFQQANMTDAQPLVLCHNGSVKGLRSVLDGCFKRPAWPTAILINRPQAAIGLASYLMQHRLRIPRDVSIVCRDYDDYFKWHSPQIAEYVFDNNLYARKAVRLIVRLVQQGLPIDCNVAPMMPVLSEGESIATR